MTTRQGASGPLTERFVQFSTSNGFDDETVAQKEYATPAAGGDTEFALLAAADLTAAGWRMPARSAVQELALRQTKLGAAAESLDITYTLQVLRGDDLLTLVPTGIEIIIKSDDTDEVKSRLSLPFALNEGDFLFLEADHPVFVAGGAPEIVKATASFVQTQVA